MPGINPVTFPFDAAAAIIDLETSPSTDIPAEPALRCYVFAAGCGGAAAAQSPYNGLSVLKKKCRKGNKGKTKKRKRRACPKKKKRRRK